LKTGLYVQMVVFRVIKLSGILSLFHHFRGICCIHLLGDWIQFLVETKVNGRIKLVNYIGRLKGLWPIRAREMEERMDLVQSQWNLQWNQFKRSQL